MRLLLVLLVATGICRASTAITPEPFTTKERNQRHSDRVILAKPLASHRASVDAAEAGEKIRVRNKFARLGGIRVIELAPGEEVDSAIARLQATGRYEFVERDHLELPDAIPNDASFASQWALNNTAQVTGYTAGADIRAVAAWDIIREAPNVVVAVIDNGFNLTHRDLAANLWRNPSPTFGDINGAAFRRGVRSGNVSDETGHGSHVAGIIGAVGNNGVNIAGIAWKVQLMALKNSDATGASASSDSAACVDYALAHGAQILNCSFGGTAYSQTFFTALKAAREAGVIVVTSAGNDGLNNDTSPHYPSNYLLDNIVSVGNSGPTDQPSISSDYGGLVDLFAPGSLILSLDLTAAGQVSRSGTSMAAPHVTGALALLKAQFPTDTYRQLINRLLRGVDRLSSYSGRAQTGGRLNLQRALTTTVNRPFNDDFASRGVIAGSGAALRANNTGATVETGEPAHAGVAATTTLWWQWTATTTGTATLSTVGSDYDTVAAVYTGTALASLTLVASNDNIGSATSSQISFSTRVGTTYQFAIGGKNGSAGLTLVNFGLAPIHDEFAGAVSLASSESVQSSGTNVHASFQLDEPKMLNLDSNASVWYRWTAPRSGRFQVAAFSFDFDTILGVFTGSEVNRLTLVTASDDTGVNGANTDSLCTFQAVAGTTYSFKVDSKNPLRTGTFVFNLTDSLWQFSTEGATTGSPAIATDGTIYIGGGTPDHNLYAITPNGTLKWMYETAGTIDNCSPAIGQDGTVYFGASDGTVTALFPDGKVRWQRALSTQSMSNSPALGIDGTIYLHGIDGYLYALDPASGATRWRTFVDALTFSSPAVGPDGTIYQASDIGYLIALQPDGAIKWRFATNSDTFSTPAIDAAGNIYFTTYTSSLLYSLTPAGTLRWSYAGASAAYTSTSPTLSADGTLAYFGSSNRYVYAINTTDGSLRWRVTVGNSLLSSTAAVDANGTVYVGCYDNRVYAINSTGTVKRSWDTGQPVRSSPTIVDRTLYIGSGDAKLYAIDIGAEAATGTWTQYRQNARRTGRLSTGSLAITLNPQPIAGVISQPYTLSVAATGADPFSFQWRKNDLPIAGATNATYSIGTAAATDVGSYSVVVQSSQGSVTSSSATVNFVPLIASRIANFSVRAGPAATTQALTLAFTVGPGATKPVLLRVAGPTLSAFGIAGVLADPQLQLMSGATALAANDNWAGDATVAAATSRVSAFPFDAASRDAALVRTLGPGGYTAQVTGANDTTGLALAEVYDTDPVVADSPGQSRLTNLSARAQVGTLSNVLIAGFTILGNVPRTILVRAIGPGLSSFGVTGAVNDPILEVYDGTTRLGRNDDWGGTTMLKEAFAQAGAFPLGATGTRDSALVLKVNPGVYTARVTGFSGATGIALVELYEVP